MTHRHAPLLALALLAACGEDDPDGGDPGTRAVALSFAAEVNGQPFSCGTTYAGVGSPAADYTASDFRFYVHGVELLTADGAVPVTLDETSFQHRGVALLDFEDGSSSCESGSPETNTVLRGTAPVADVTGVRLTIGVPASLNHVDATTAPAPLDVTAMFWVWRAGYKFIRADGLGGGSAFNLHLGSTGCLGDAPTRAPSEPCSVPNRPTVELRGFDPSTDTIVADVGAVLAGVDVTKNTPDTAPGCMSAPDDPECGPVFPRLGLPFGGAGPGQQAFLRVR